MKMLMMIINYMYDAKKHSQSRITDLSWQPMARNQQMLYHESRSLCLRQLKHHHFHAILLSNRQCHIYGNKLGQFQGTEIQRQLAMPFSILTFKPHNAALRTSSITLKTLRETR